MAFLMFLVVLVIFPFNLWDLIFGVCGVIGAFVYYTGYLYKYFGFCLHFVWHLLQYFLQSLYFLSANFSAIVIFQTSMMWNAESNPWLFVNFYWVSFDADHTEVFLESGLEWYIDMYLLVWGQVCHKWSWKKVLKGGQLTVMVVLILWNVCPVTWGNCTCLKLAQSTDYLFKS